MRRGREPQQGLSGEWRALLRRPGYLGFALTVAPSQISSLIVAVSGVLLVLDRTGQSITTAALALGQAVGGGTIDLTGKPTPAIVVFACADVCAAAWLTLANRRRAPAAA